MFLLQKLASQISPLLCFTILFCLLSSIGCPAPTQPPVQTLELSADYIGAKEVWLRVTATQSRGVRVTRNGVTIFTNNSLLGETLVVDSSLVPSRSYTYTATPLKDGRDVDEPSRLQVTTLDTTSHTVSWQIDTLGAQGLIRDVWVFDQNNVWAVGEIQVETGQPAYGAAVWNGSSWTLRRLEALGPTGTISNLRPRGIYAFLRTDIWLASGGVFHWNGQSITPYWINSFPGNPNPILSEGQTAEKIWGTSSSNIYAVGRGGAIAHYNGTVWRKMESGTTVDLEDIWGIDEKHVWTTGFNVGDGRSVVLEYDGNKWSTLYDNTRVPSAERLGFSSVWTNSPSVLTATGVSGPARLHPRTKLVRREESGQVYISYCIRGTNSVDIFMTGAGSEVLHFNGSSWYRYEQAQTITRSTARWLTVKISAGFVLVGGWTLTELSSSTPVILRGYR